MFHGIKISESTAGTRALATVATAVIGLVATAPNADAATFPLDRPVQVTDLPAAIDQAGAGGTLRTCLQAIADEVRAPVIVVRVAPGVDAAATNAAVIGTETNGVKTGMQALLAAPAQLAGLRPRIIAAPGLDTQPVTAALAVLARKLNGFAYAAAIGANVAAAITYAANFDARELMLVYPDFIAFDPVGGANVTSYGPARAVALRARIDQEQGWHKTISNVPVSGVLGLTKDIQWDLQSDATEAALSNAAGITALVHGGDGYCFWGNRTRAGASEPLFTFETAVRTGQVLRDTIGEGLRWAIDKPLVPSLAKDIVESINALFRQLKAEGRIIGATASFDPAKNGQATLAAGQLSIDFDYTPVPPLEGLLVTQRITDTYLADFAAAVAA
ncbi:phage tail sheath subtilisin-like domain-containing protein [Sphingomonas sp.]|uniref:phage tail sheath subtilisin-like domain-containing protein n=1 Tax=Sphingomonas sp. TaxID=28214 RepID=UPI003B3B3082